MKQSYQNQELKIVIKRIKEQAKYFFLPVLIFLLIVAASSLYYTVEPDEEAVVLRLGKYIKTEGPGLHFKIPFGVDQALKVKTQLVLQEEFGFRTQSVSGKRTTYSGRNFSHESLMLTGDLNVAEVEWITQFQISDPKKFLFHARDPVENIRDISEAVMRRVVGDHLVDDVLTEARVEIAEEAAQLIQSIMDNYDMGVRIVSIKLQDVNPPDEVKASFNEVNSAKQEQEEAINQAEKTYNKVIPEARGKAEESVARAEGYATSVVNEALGDAERFNLLLNEYKRAPSVTRERLYLDNLKKLFSRLEDLTLVDSSIKGLLPIYQNARELSK